MDSPATRATEAVSGGGDTPASAGRTSGCSWWARRPAEHPRVGGEDSGLTSNMTIMDGTPPRGGEDRCASGRGRARHGTPPRRWGGRKDIDGPSPKIGTPPRRRGGRIIRILVTPPVRNTLASARRTTTVPSRPAASQEHSRVGGEDGMVTFTRQRDGGTPPHRREGLRRRDYNRVQSGTPPRRRGGQRLQDGYLLLQRNTPASAGRTPHPCSAPSR